MIERMKKVTLLTLREDREKSLMNLRDIGVMHVHTADTKETADLSVVIRELDALNRTIERLETYQAAVATEVLPPLLLDTDPLQLIASVETIIEELEWIREELATWEHAAEQARPWGVFDHTLLEQVREAGLDIRLCTWPTDAPPQFEDGVVVHEVQRTKSQIYAAAMALKPISAPLDEVHLSQHSIQMIEENIAICRERLDYRNHEMLVLASYLDQLRKARLLHVEQSEYLQVRNAMADADKCLVLVGYVPATQISALVAYSRKHGWAMISADPAEDDLHVPTKISVPKWLDVAKPIFDFIGIQPGYREFDISAWFLIFLSVFFAMIIGDAGYGVLMLAGVMAAKMKMDEKARVTLNLLLIFSVATIAWGVVTGNYFGLEQAVLPSALKSLEIAWLATDVAKDAHVQFLCFLLGAIHLSLAHIWKALIAAPHPKFLSQVGWVLVLWANFLLAVQLVCDVANVPFIEPYMAAMIPLYISGGVLILFMSSPSVNPLKMVGGGMAAIVGGGVNSFVDLLSYIRLFAVGLAGFYVAQSFNSIGVSLSGSFFGMIAAAVVIIFGHALNIALCGLGVLVHGVRLNTLEFSGHMGIEWAGVPYRAFARRFKRGEADS